MNMKEQFRVIQAAGQLGQAPRRGRASELGRPAARSARLASFRPLERVQPALCGAVDELRARRPSCARSANLARAPARLQDDSSWRLWRRWRRRRWRAFVAGLSSRPIIANIERRASERESRARRPTAAVVGCH